MGIAAMAAETQRLREQLELAQRELQQKQSVIDQQAQQLLEAQQQIAALTESNETLARKLATLELKLTGRKNERHTDPEQATLPSLCLDGAAASSRSRLRARASAERRGQEGCAQTAEKGQRQKPETAQSRADD